jgi:hypothetical protein
MSSHKTTLPQTIYVVELQDHVVLTGFDIGTDCVFPAYRFDRQHQAAYIACEDIAIKRGKKVADMVAFSPHKPHVYDPIKTRRIQSTKRNDTNTRFPGIAKSILSLEAEYIDREKRAFAIEKEDTTAKLKHIIA